MTLLCTSMPVLDKMDTTHYSRSNQRHTRKDSMTRTLHELPESEAKRLQTLREAGPNALPQLRARVALLRDAGWSLAAVGAPLGANRSTTRMWQMSAKPEDVNASIKEFGAPDNPPIRMSSLKTVRIYPDVPVEEREELVRLAASARRVRGWTESSADAWRDAREFERRLVEYKKRGVPVKRMAEHIGVTHHAVAARLARVQAKAAS